MFSTVLDMRSSYTHVIATNRCSARVIKDYLYFDSYEIIFQFDPEVSLINLHE